MKIKELFEGLSSVVYHFTTFDKAEKILKSNSLISNIGEISFSRSITGSYPNDHRMIGCIFEMDGDLISQNKKAKPIGGEDYDDYDYDVTIFTGKSSQMEDRLYSKQVPNINTAIKRAFLYIPLDLIKGRREDHLDGNYRDQLTHLKNVYMMLSSMKIPIFFAMSRKDLVDVSTRARFMKVDQNDMRVKLEMLRRHFS
jgi:hypothetical protein